MRRLARKVEREKIVLAAMPELPMGIVEHAREYGRITIGEMPKLTGTSRNTLKGRFRQLLRRGHIAMHSRRPGCLVCPAIVPFLGP